MPFDTTRRRLVLASAATPLMQLPRLALAEAGYPNHAIRWIVAYPAGGGSDFLARQLAPQLGQQLGVQMVIDNRPGAAGMIGTDIAARSAPDGYTILTGDNGAMVFNTALYKTVPYVPKDFVPLGFMASFPLILVVHPQSGFSSAAQWIDTVKKAPGKYSYASPGTGSPHHLAMELLKERIGAFIVHVPYRGTAMALQDVMAAQVPMMVVDTAGGLAQIRAGKVRALAVMSPRRLPSLPDVPTLDEIGVSGFETTAWQGLFAPKGTPADIASRLGTEMQKAITAPKVKKALEDFGLDVTPTDGAQLAARIQRETVFWHQLIHDKKLQAD